MRPLKALQICSLLLLGIALSFSFGCSDKGNNPTPHTPDYHVLAGAVFHGPDYADPYALIASTSYDSIIDSIPLTIGYELICVSPDGSTIYHTRLHGFGLADATWSTDFMTGDTISFYPGLAGFNVVVSPDNEYLYINGVFDIHFFELPNLNVIYSTTKNAGNDRMPAVFLPAGDTIILCEGDTIKRIILSDDPITSESFPVLDTLGGSIGALGISSFPTGDSLIIQSANKILIMDSETMAAVREYTIPANLYQQSVMVLSYDNEYLYFNFEGNIWATPPIPGIIYRLNLENGEVMEYINGAHYGPVLINLFGITPDNRELLFFGWDGIFHDLYIRNLSTGRDRKIEIVIDSLLDADKIFNGSLIEVVPLDYSQ